LVDVAQAESGGYAERRTRLCVFTQAGCARPNVNPRNVNQRRNRTTYDIPIAKGEGQYRLNAEDIGGLVLIGTCADRCNSETANYTSPRRVLRRRR
jgi:hypothetical protein